MLNIGLFHFPLLSDPCFLPFYTTITFKSYISPTFSYRECFLFTCFIHFYMYSDAQLISWIPRLKRNGPLNAQGIEQILKRNGLLKDNDIGRVLNVLAWRKELRSLKGMSYLYIYTQLPTVTTFIRSACISATTCTCKLIYRYLLTALFCEVRCVYVLML